MSLHAYHAKRDFDETREPAGEVARSGRRRFVVQEHHATRLHYDFRLEMNGVLKSWAIPKGPSLNPSERRLAVQVEDHPVDYIDFEGNIAEGNYGAGEVLIWDRGEYDLVDGEDPASELAGGRLKLWLKGDQLRGEFNLVEMKGRDGQWLLIKAGDEFADPDWELEPVLPQAETENQHQEPQRPARPRARPQRPQASRRNQSSEETVPEVRALQDVPGSRQAALPGFVEPMLATLVDRPFSDPDWLFETKWDGVRALCYVDGERVRLWSRNEKEMSFRYPELAGLSAAIEAGQAILDGEIVALDESDRSSFQQLQARVGLQDPAEIERLARERPVSFMAFDLLFRDGYDLRDAPLTHRKALLQRIVQPGQRLRYSDHIVADGERAFAAAQEAGFEGVIAKRQDSPYQSGRSGDWLKIKTQRRQEVVVGGYTEPRRSRPYFGALVVGLYRGDDLVFVGHVGGGFDHATLAQVYELMQPLRTERSPFVETPATNEAVHWLQPKLVAEVKFAEWTADQCLRQPIFLGLRDDKDPRQCTFEQAQSTTRQVAQAEQEAASARGGGTAAEAPPVAASKALSRKNLAGSLQLKTRRHVVNVTHLDRVYWPDAGYTKGDLLHYFWQVAKYMLPYLENRPLILVRHPDGLGGSSFFQHDVDDVPEFVNTYATETEAGRQIDYAVCNNRATLLYLANLGAFELNPWQSRVTNIDHPDWIVFDLDPGEVSYAVVCEAALAVKDVLDRLGLEACAKTSGSRGMHVYVPVKAVHTYATVASFAERIAALVVQENPGTTTLERSKKKRPIGHVYVDHLQNARGKSVVAPYAVRARPAATVSAPLTWREVKRHVEPGEFTLKSMPKRLSKTGDVFAPVLDKKQTLDRALGRLDKLRSPE